MKITNKRKDNGTLKKRKLKLVSKIVDSISQIHIPYFLKNNSSRYKSIYKKRRINYRKKIKTQINDMIRLFFKIENNKKWNKRFNDYNYYKYKKNTFDQWREENKDIIKEYLNSIEDKCSICHEKICDNNLIAKFIDKESCIALKCKHVFHIKCMYKWSQFSPRLSRNSKRKRVTCPLCRNYNKDDFFNKIKWEYK